MLDELRNQATPLGDLNSVSTLQGFTEAVMLPQETIICVAFTAKWCGPWRMIKPGICLPTRVE